MQRGCLSVTRIVFSKTGYAKYISHLDLNRCMSRLIARADVPIWYTQGFNPHPYMVFSAALPTGVCGEHELLDIKLVTKPDYSSMLDRMNEKAPDGIAFREIYDSENDFKNIAKAVYSIYIPNTFEEHFDAFLSLKEMPVLKKTKSKEITIDLKTEIHTEKTGRNKDFTVYTAVAPCGNDKNVSPTLLIDYFKEKTGVDCALNISRIAFLDQNAETFR